MLSSKTMLTVNLCTFTSGSNALRIILRLNKESSKVSPVWLEKKYLSTITRELKFTLLPLRKKSHVFGLLLSAVSICQPRFARTGFGVLLVGRKMTPYFSSIAFASSALKSRIYAGLTSSSTLLLSTLISCSSSLSTSMDVPER